MSNDDYILAAKKIESLLKKVGATGTGLHEKITSIEEKISTQDIKKLRIIATTRNKLAHEDGFNVNDMPNDYFEICSEIESSLLSGQGDTHPTASKNRLKPTSTTNKIQVRKTRAFVNPEDNAECLSKNMLLNTKTLLEIMCARLSMQESGSIHSHTLVINSTRQLIKKLEMLQPEENIKISYVQELFNAKYSREKTGEVLAEINDFGNA